MAHLRPYLFTPDDPSVDDETWRARIRGCVVVCRRPPPPLTIPSLSPHYPLTILYKAIATSHQTYGQYRSPPQVIETDMAGHWGLRDIERAVTVYRRDLRSDRHSAPLAPAEFRVESWVY